MAAIDPESPREHVPRLTPAADALLHTNVPVIAAVNGAAVGWGMELALMADLRVASEKARFGELFVMRGLVSDAPGLGRLAQLVGREKPPSCSSPATSFRPTKRCESVWCLVLLPTTSCCRRPMHWLRRSRRTRRWPCGTQGGLRRTLDPDWIDTGKWVSSTLARLFQTEDHREGVKSFLERRAPVFKGR